MQDQAAPADWEQIEEVLCESLGAPPAEIFADLCAQPVAAAPIAQVHRARLLNGEGRGAAADVAIKVQRPDIRGAVERDLNMVLRMAGTLQERTEWRAAPAGQFMALHLA